MANIKPVKVGATGMPKVHVVVTTYKDGENEYFADVVRLLTSEDEAAALVEALADNRNGVKGAKKELRRLKVEPNVLVPYEGEAYFEREIDGAFSKAGD